MDEMAGLAFVYIALPLAVALFLLFPARMRAGALLVFSLVYFFVLSPAMVPFMLVIAATDFGAIAVISRFDHSRRTREACLAFSGVKNIGTILIFQGAALGWQAGPETALGLYVVALSGLGCVLEAYRREIPDGVSPVKFGLYCFFFPRLAAGPMTSYRAFAPQLKLPGVTPGQIGNGLYTFLQGAVKFRLLGEGLHIFYQTLRDIPQEEVSVVGVWLGVFALALSVYLRFSGVADMARGVAGMVGVSLSKNFNYPFESRSVGEFFARFNFSLTGYVRDALGPRYSDGLAGLVTLGIASGLWFGLSAGRLAWGIFMAIFLLLERVVYPGFVKKAPALLGWVYTLLVILVSFALFDAGSAVEISGNLTAMFGFDGLPFWNDRLGYLLVSNRLLVIAGALLGTSILARIGDFFKTRMPKGVLVALTVLASLLLLALLTAFLL